MKICNPFVTTGYAGREYFCDRVRETEEIISRLDNGNNLTLLSPRRYGKTGLVCNVLEVLKRRGDVATVYVDILSTRNLAEFTKVFAAAVFPSVESSFEKAGAAAAKFLRACRPTVTFDELTHLPKFSFDVVPSEADLTLESVFDYLKSRKTPIVIAFDEFQQVAEYPEKGTEALLRSRIQFLPEVRFIFSGSRMHMMAEMFHSPKRPFYQSTSNLNLGLIDRDKYYAFAAGFFRKAKRMLPRETFDVLYGRFEGITWYVQSVLKGLYAGNSARPDSAAVDEVVLELVRDNADMFNYILSKCTDGAAALLRAIAKAGPVAEPTASEFLHKYHLPAPSSVKYALTKLLEDELVYKTDAGYVVYDRLLGEWLRSIDY